MSVRKASGQSVNATSSMTNPGPGGLTAPVISRVIYTDSSYVSLDDTAISLNGGYVSIIGSGFSNVFSLFLNGIQVAQGNTTYVSSTEVRAILPASSLGTYSLMLFNGNNSGSVLPNSVFYSPFPTYGTPIAINVITGVAFTQQLGASGDNPLVYSIVSGTLPTGVAMSSGGLLSGTATGYTNSQTFNFTIKVDDPQLQTITQAISLTVSTADQYWGYTSLFLNGETSVTPFINDASTNSFPLTIQGDTKATKFSPYYGDGYYSIYCPTSSYVRFPASTNYSFTGNFTIEAWINMDITSSGPYTVFGMQSGGSWFDFRYFSNNWQVSYNSGGGTNMSGTMKAGVWTHVALVRNSGVVSVYVNGVGTGTTISNSATLGFSTVPAGIGNDANGGNQYIGYISNLRVVNGTAVYTSNFTPSTAPLTAITNTVLLTAQSNKFMDTSSSAAVATMVGTVSVSSAIPFTANSSYSTYGSAYFDGTGDTLTWPSSSSVAFGTGDFTVECWIYPISVTTTSVFVFDARSASQATNWCCGFGMAANNGLLSWWTGTTAYSEATVSVKLSAWNHIAFSRSSGTLKLFMNGTQVLSTADSTNYNISPTISYLGGRFDQTGQVIGYMNDARIIKGTALYTTTFTPPIAPLTAVANTQLLTLQYNGGANNSGIIDNSNFNNIITRVGNTTQGTFSPYSVTGWSNYFNGSTDFINTSTSTAYSISTNDYCLEGWAMFTGSFGTTAIFLSNFFQNVSGDYGSYVGINASGYPYGYLQNGNAGGQTVALTGSTLITRNAWIQYALVRNGANLSLFVDGVRVATSAVAGVIQPAHNVVTLGRYSSNNSLLYWTGYVSNARMYVATTPYSATATTITVPTSPLTAITGTVYLSAQSNRFVDNSAIASTLTASGAPSIQAYSPFGSIREAAPISYSNYFDGTGDYLYLNNQLALGSGNFTIEMWLYMPDVTTSRNIYEGRPISTNGAYPTLYIVSGTLKFSTNSADRITSSTVLVNTWYHVAIVRNSGTTIMYLNGTQTGSSYTDGTTYLTGANRPIIGSFDGSSGSYIGYISNIRVMIGTALYTTTFTPSATPLTAISGTSLLTCQSITMIDNSVNNFTLTANGDTKPKQFNPFGYTAQSATSYTPSIHGGSAYFDGNGDYLASVSSTIPAFGTGNFTVEFWVYPTVNARQDWIDCNSGTPRFLFYYDGTNITYYSTSARITGGAITLNSWQHIAVSRSAGSTKMFVNGVQVGSTYTDTINYGSSTVTIGRDAAGSTYATGYLSDIRIINGTSLYTSNFVSPSLPLSSSTTAPASLLLNFTNGGVIDQHSSAVLETVGNAQVSTSVKKYGNASIYFDGTGDYLQFPENPMNWYLGAVDFTIEAWVNISVTNASEAYIIARSQHGVGSDWFLGLSATNQLKLYMSTGGANVVTSTGTITVGAWTHIAATRSGTSFRLFINGVLDGTLTSSVVLGTSYGPTVVSNASNNTGSHYLNGYIDELRITKGYARYTSNFTAPTSALITR